MTAPDLNLVIEGPFEFGRNVTGTILWRWNNTSFPGEKWSDFPVIVVSWWLKELTSLTAGGSERVELDFMDGPYAVEVEAEGALWLMKFMRRAADSATTVDRFAIQPDALIASVVTGAKSLVETCRSNKWSSDDLAQIEKYLATLAPANA
jgi:hypothetical protein